MGRTTTASRSRSAARDVELAEEPVGLELIGVGLCLGAVVLGGALATLAPIDGAGAFQNVAGRLGASVAGALTRAVGLGAWVFPLFALGWGISAIRGRRPDAWGLRALLLPLLAALVGTAGALLLGTTPLPGLGRSGPGGYVGVAFATSLYRVLGRASGLVALVACLGLLRYATGIGLRGLVTSLFERLGGVAEIDEEEELDEYDDEEEYDDEGDEEYEYEYEEGDEDEEYEDEEDEPVAKPAKAKRARKPEKATPKAPPPRKPAPKAPIARRRAKGRALAARDVGAYVFPPTDLLDEGVSIDSEAVREEVEANAKVLQDSLASFGVEAEVVSSERGPVITFYELAIASGVRLNRVTALADDLAIALKAPSVRIVAPIPGRSTVGVEVPNLTREVVRYRDLIEEASQLGEQRSLPMFIGRDTAGRPLVEDLAKMPHLLIAGATGSGKSVCINSVLLSIIYTRTPAQVSLILIDPKQVELSFFEGTPHLITPVVTDMKRAAKILEWAVDRMEERYTLLLAAGVRNITGYNALSKEKLAAMRERVGMAEEDAPDEMSQVVIVVDELADLMMTSGKEVELAITRLAQKSRAVGIHIILATQRPSTNVITGLIKANMPTRIGFCVSSKIDSRVILDANGADKLLGMGDMLYMNPRSLHLKRGQGVLVTDAEVRSVVDFLKENCPAPELQDLLAQQREGVGNPMDEDDLYEDAVRVVLSTRLGSASMLQRRMSIGYTRASRLIDMMCDHGVVGPHVGSKAREVLLTLEEWEAMLAEQTGNGPSPSAVFDHDDPPCVDESWD